MSEINNNNEGGSREGYTSSNHDGGNRNQGRGNFGRVYSSDNGRGRNYYNDGRPGYSRGGYQQHGGYQQGGYQQHGEGYQGNFHRPQNGEGGFNGSEGYQSGGQRRQFSGGYQQRGGFQHRGGYQQGGYQQRGESYQSDGQRRTYSRQGGYQQRGGFQNGGYQQRGEGYQGDGQRRSFNREGGYAQRGGFPGRKPNNYKRQNPGKRRIDYKEVPYDPNEPIRLNKFLANAGVCSRRDADKYIAAGVVTVNGEIITELGHKVLRSDVVLFHDQQVKAEKKVYVLLNKPKGYVTTSEDPQNRKTVMDLVAKACRERIYPVGRLDRNTTGVLLLTNDGELASKLTHPMFLKKKIYHVYLDRNVTAGDIRQIAEGITLEDGDIKADAIDYASDTDKKQVGIEIHSGRNRIVRRIFESLGYHVVKLDRVYFAGLTKKNVKRGDWRFLTEEEVNMLRMGAFE